MMDDCTFENEKYIQYGEEGATFIRRCCKCMRFVKAPEKVFYNGLDEVKIPKVNCSKCGETEMIFIGYV